jgi:hypothetical protein
MAKHVWTQGDDIIVLYVYRFGASSLGQTIEELAAMIGTTPASLRMRIRNFKALDGHGGLANAAELSRQVYERNRLTDQATLRTLALHELTSRR